jgi:protocatechuate 3,4-dioxygenase alpha subunit
MMTARAAPGQVTGRTPAQTIGPFFGFALPWDRGAFVVDADAPGALWIRGQILDGAGEPVADALVETWQADPSGDFAGRDGSDRAGGWFRGFARCPTDAAGQYALRTVKPGRVPAPDRTLQAPHIDVLVFARGLLNRLLTKIYFADEAVANAADPLLTRLDPESRATLLAPPAADGYRFDIRLQGDQETAFFDV